MASRKRYRNYRKYNRYERKREGQRSLAVFYFTVALLLFLACREKLSQFFFSTYRMALNFFQQSTSVILLTSIVVLLFSLLLVLYFRISNRSIANKYGYLFHPFNGYQHRQIASRHLGRKLKWNEEVHHINGVTSDNYSKNLCVLDRESHKIFHRWLKDEKDYSGDYPSQSEQIDMLHRLQGRTFF